MWMRRFILFLIRKRLGVKKGVRFQFINQKTKAVYWFTKDEILKYDRHIGTYPSGVSINWVLDPNCKIREVEYDTNIKKRSSN